MTANPNFRWYKLPAPPLRTLTTRPMTKNSTPLSSPTSPLTSEFTPGKLADESQLGGLTSLMNNNYAGIGKKDDEDVTEETKYIEKTDIPFFNAETDNNRYGTPPKPLKKRFVELYADDMKYMSSRGFFGEGESKDMGEEQADTGSVTKQDLVNKVSRFNINFKKNSFTYKRI